MENNYYRQWAARVGEVFITEQEFRAATDARRSALADDIRNSGLSLNHIGKGTRLGRKTIARAARGEDVRLEAQDRIRYYLQQTARELQPEHVTGFSTTKTYDGQTIETK